MVTTKSFALGKWLPMWYHCGKGKCSGHSSGDIVIGAVLSVSGTLLVLAIGTVGVQVYMSCDAALAMTLADKHDIQWVSLETLSFFVLILFQYNRCTILSRGKVPSFLLFSIAPEREIWKADVWPQPYLVLNSNCWFNLCNLSLHFRATVPFSLFL